MLLTAILSLVAVVAGAAVSSPEAVAPVSLAARGGQCPAGYDYRGWFDKVNGIPPQCKVHVSRPRPMKKPSCPRGQAAYCSIDPGHFCPYGESPCSPPPYTPLPTGIAALLEHGPLTGHGAQTPLTPTASTRAWAGATASTRTRA